MPDDQKPKADLDKPREELRKRIIQPLTKRNLSLRIDRNHSFLSEYLKGKTPRLQEQDRERLAKILKCDPDLFKAIDVDDSAAKPDYDPISPPPSVPPVAEVEKESPMIEQRVTAHDQMIATLLQKIAKLENRIEAMEAGNPARHPRKRG